MGKRYFLALLLLLALSIQAQNFPQTEPRRYVSDSTVILKRAPWRATAEVIGVNLFVGSFNRYIANQDFAKINFKSIKRNFKTGPVWDTDKFSTNLVAHPYHGSLYFNAARSNGMNFWESLPYTLGGSFMWEFFMETEPPSINDLIATTIGGASLGEMTFRLSDLFIDDRTTGRERVGREVLTGIISPIRALNRIVTGEAWQKRNYKGRVYRDIPVNFIVNAGPRYMFEREDPEDYEVSMNVALRLDYGEPYGYDTYGPYDWFQLRASLDFFGNQTLISQVNAIGILWGKTVWERGHKGLTAGIFQHFDYYDSKMKTKAGDIVYPYRISEVAAVGGGLLYTNSSPEEKVEIFAEGHINGIALGGSKTDYFFLDERDYNLGSGYSAKIFAGITFNKRWSFLMNAENYHIFTWKGYDPSIDLTEVDYETFNVQGDKGHARLTVFTTQLGYFSPKRWNIMLTNRYFSRNTYYKYHDNVTTSTSDVVLSVGFRI